MRGFLILTICIVFLTNSCKEDTGFDITQLEPIVKLSFINTDSLPKALQELQLLNDSLSIVNDLISMGATDLDIVAALLQTEIDLVNEEIETILAGRTIIDNVESPEGMGNIQFPDSAEIFPFPLSISTDQSTFYVTIGNDIDTVQIVYEREITEEPGVILFTNFNTQISLNTYDSVRVDCDSLCISNETSISLYY